MKYLLVLAILVLWGDEPTVSAYFAPFDTRIDCEQARDTVQAHLSGLSEDSIILMRVQCIDMLDPTTEKMNA